MTMSRFWFTFLDDFPQNQSDQVTCSTAGCSGDLILKKERKCHWGPLWKHTRKSGSKQHHSSVVATENSTSCVHSPDNESSFAWQEGPHKGFRHNNTITLLLIKFHFSFASNFILIFQLLYEQETHCNTSWNKSSSRFHIEDKQWSHGSYTDLLYSNSTLFAFTSNQEQGGKGDKASFWTERENTNKGEGFAQCNNQSGYFWQLQPATQSGPVWSGCELCNQQDIIIFPPTNVLY